MYQVVKKIKGHSYLYNQRTYRDKSGTVKTISQYVGPVDLVGYPKSQSKSKNQSKSHVQTVVESVDLVTASGEPKQTPETPDQAAMLPESNLGLTLQNCFQSKVDLKHYGIHQASLESNYREFIKEQHRLGNNVSPVPKITIKRAGSTVKHKKTWSGNYEILIPRQQPKDHQDKTFIDAVNIHHERIMADIYLGAVEKNNPKLFNKVLKPFLKKAYTEQNKAIVSYINHSKRKRGVKTGLTLHYKFSKMVSTWTQAHLDPKLVGFVDYSSRKNWREDSVLVMSEIQQTGWLRTYRKYTAQLEKTENQVFYLIKKHKELSLFDRLSGKSRAMRKDIKKLNARRRAVFATCDKVSVLSNLYPTKQSKEAFSHHERWEDKKPYWKTHGRDVNSFG